MIKVMFMHTIKLNYVNVESLTRLYKQCQQFRQDNVNKEAQYMHLILLKVKRDYSTNLLT